MKIAKRKGFTLIEVLVVIFVLGIGLIGALSFFNINLNNQFEAKNELIAAGLAQEATDLVRNVADHNYLNNISPWYDELYNNIDSSKDCSSIDRDVILGDSFKCGKNAKKDIKVCFSPTNGYYYQANNGGNCRPGDGETIFDRSIIIGPDPTGGGCLQVVASVKWNGRETKVTDLICKPRQ